MRGQTRLCACGCGEALPFGSKAKTLNQSHRTRLARRKKAIQKRAAAVRCNIYAVWLESQKGPHSEEAARELRAIIDYAHAAHLHTEHGGELRLPLDDYNTVLGFVPESVKGVEP